MSDPTGFRVPHDLASPIRGRPDGPLSGRSFVAKDLFEVAGHRSSCGNPDFRRLATPAARTAPAINRLLDAGADLLGMAICCEFFFSITGVNAHYGTPPNTRAPGRLPGGSSSGSAAAVAAGRCDLALGSDTGGSVRIPASFCGVHGIRPTWGRVDLSGARPMAPSFDVAGWFADEPELFAGIGALLLDGERVGGPVERLVLATDGLDRSDAPVAAALRSRLADGGGLPDCAAEVVLARDGLEGWRDAFGVLQGYEIQATNVPWILRHEPDLAPDIRSRHDRAAGFTSEQAEQADRIRAAARRRLDHVAPPGTVVVFPTAPCVAPPLDASDEELLSFRTRAMCLTCISGLTGRPEVSLPLLEVDGLPVGLSLLGWPGGDEALLDLAVELSGGEMRYLDRLRHIAGA
jgi:amidase